MASTMQLEFSQAMTDFKTMFPEMDDDVIEAVLRANQGAVDATIDQLLAMSTDNQNERLRIEMEQVEDGTSRPAIQENNGDLIDVSDDTIPLAVRKKWVPKLLGPLPPTFLRIPNRTDARVDLSLEMDDERIASLLQNEEFMAELRWNQEFMAALDSEQEQKTKPDDEADFKERLKTMGKMSKKKFAQLSRMFSRGAGGSRRPGGGKVTRGPPDRRLLQEEHSDEEDRPQTNSVDINSK